MANKLFKFLLCSSLMCLTVADFKDLSRKYVTPSPGVTIDSADEVADLIKNDIVDNNLNMAGFEPFAKDTVNDPGYGNSPYGYNGLSGSFPSAYPAQVFPGQNFPRPVFPGQGFPAQGFLPQQIPQQGFSSQIISGQGFLPSQGLVNPAFPTQAFPIQGFPGQGFGPQGFPIQTFISPGFPVQRFPTPQTFLPPQNFVNPGFTGQGYTNYHIVYSTEQPKKKETIANENIRLRLVNSDTQYDATNGGYLYKKPSVTIKKYNPKS